MSALSRVCHFCQTTVLPADAVCETCISAFPSRRPVSEMTPEERVTELLAWGGPLEVPFVLVHERVTELMGRAVWTHELADFDALAAEIRAGQPASLADALNKIPSDLPVIVVGTE